MKVIAWDTETRGLEWFNPDQQAFLATWADEDGEYCADLSNPEQTARFTAAIKAADVVVAHNLSFDVHQTRESVGLDVLGLEGVELHDTDLMSRVLHPEGQRAGRGGHGLKNLATVYLRQDATESEDAIKEMGKQIGLRTLNQTGAYFDVWRAYPEVMERYAVNDARFTYDLYMKFSEELADAQQIWVYDLEMAVAPVLIRAEERGIRVDPVAVARLKAEYEPRLQEVRSYLEDEIGAEALGGEGSGQALTEALLALGVPLYRKTASGQLATHKFALHEFAKDFPQLAKLEEYRTLSRFISTYVKAVEGRDTVHASFQQCEAWTGRMSCRRPNMQNWPKRAGKEVRAVFIPRKACAFVVCDYESIEVRLLAHYLGDAGFRKLIADGLDPHAWMAANIWGGEPHDYAKGSAREADRNLAKQILFAITYGAGAPRIADMLADAGFDVSPDAWETEAEARKVVAKSIIAKIKSSLPNYYGLQKRIRSKIESVGYVNTLFGRKNPVNPDKAYVGLNALIQGSAADIMKQGLVNVAAAVEPYGGIPLLVVHDEIVVECPIVDADAVLLLTEEALVAAYDLDPPLSVSGSIVTTSYADA